MKTTIVCLYLLVPFHGFTQYGPGGRYHSEPSPGLKVDSDAALAGIQNANAEAQYNYQVSLAVKAQQQQDAANQLQSTLDWLNSNIEKNELSLAEAIKYPDQLKAKILSDKQKIPENPWRQIDGVATYVKTDSRFKSFNVKIVENRTDGTLVMAMGLDEFCIKNFPFKLVDGTRVEIFAIPSGTYSFVDISGAIKTATRTVSEFDYGIPCARPEGGLEIEKEAMRLNDADNITIQSAIDDIEKKRNILAESRQSLTNFVNAIEAAKQKAKELADAPKLKALKYNQDSADRGDEYGELRMGERYLTGDGVPKNLDKAREYLTKAAAQGSIEASNKLAMIH